MTARKKSRFQAKWKPLNFPKADYLKLVKIRTRHGPIYRKGGADVYRPTIGENELEQRAEQGIYGSLPERILYKELKRRRIEFSFQSSMMGGRQQLGGMVADFILPFYKIIIQVQGTLWHVGKDAEAWDTHQRLTLENMGYTILYIWDTEVYDKEQFKRWLDKNIGELA
jgi:very-short-patch-repair endonuclease